MGEAFGKICLLATALGVRRIINLPGCWEHDVDGVWWLAMNGHKEATVCSRDVTVLPFHVYVEFNGWPAGILSPEDGTIAAGAAANEDTLIAALDAAIAEAEARDAG